MKKLLLFLSFSIASFQSSIANYSEDINKVARLQNIDNGWYKATVQYFNPSTYTKSTYTLNVKVQYNSVVAIDFGNGGSVHNGYNNEGYAYIGGTLFFQKDYEGNITAATTRVTIIQGGRTTYYDVSL